MTQHLSKSAMKRPNTKRSLLPHACAALCALFASLAWSPLNASAQSTDAPAQAAPSDAPAQAPASDTVALPQSEDTGTPSGLATPPVRAVTASPERDAFDAAIRESREGERQKLIAAFRSLVNDEELGVYAVYNLGVLAWERGDLAEARQQFEEALRKQPGFGPALAALVRSSLFRGEIAEAESLIAAQRAASDNASGVRTAALYVALHKGDWNTVVRDTRSVLIDNPNDIEAQFALATAYLNMGRHELAEYVLTSASRRDDSRADIPYGLGRIALSRGQTEVAREHFEEAVRRAPAFPEANIDLAALRLAKMDYAPVVEAMQEVTKVVPRSAAAWVTLGSGLKGMRRYDEAKVAFDHALTLDPQSAAAVFNLGILYLDVQDFEGLDQLSRMAKVNEYFARYRELRGTIADSDPVIGYEAFVRDEIAMQEELARQAAEDAERARRRAEQEAARAAEEAEGAGDAEPSEGSGGEDWDDWDDW